MNLAFFASGSGSNVQAILDNIKSGKVQAEPKVIITNNSKAGIVEKALKEEIPYYHISSHTHPDEKSRTERILSILKENKIDLIILAGYMKKISEEIISNYKNKILNIHPALLPKYGGEGMFGMNVHKAVIASGEKESGATVHLVNSEYDRGRILTQRTIEIPENTSPEILQKMVLKIEHIIYSETIENIINGKIKI